MTEHLDIWNKVRTPDPKYTKAFNRGGGFKGTATNTQYQIMRLTEVFGPNGIGWGYEITDEQYIAGAPLEGCNETVHVVRGYVWYMLDGERHQTSEQFGQTTFIGKNKYGVYTDEEAPKKSITDMFLKCAALLGFSADIFLGLFDDNKYVNDAKAYYNGNGQKGNNGNNNKGQQPGGVVSEDQRKELESLVNDTDSDVGKFLKFAGVKTFEEIPVSRFGQLKKMLEGKIK